MKMLDKDLSASRKALEDLDLRSLLRRDWKGDRFVSPFLLLQVLSTDDLPTAASLRSRPSTLISPLDSHLRLSLSKSR
jgi:hypothetical protein